MCSLTVIRVRQSHIAFSINCILTNVTKLIKYEYLFIFIFLMFVILVRYLTFFSSVYFLTVHMQHRYQCLAHDE